MQHKIESHNFDEAKQKIQSFSNNIPAIPSLKKVKEDVGPFGLMDHDVSGKEFNELVSNVQNSIITTYGCIENIIHEFREIYEAFEALDKDYIQGILISLKATKNVSCQALEISKRLDCTQKELQSTVNKLVVVVKKFAEFKKNIENAQLVKELANSNDINQIKKTLDDSKKIIDENKYYEQENKKIINEFKRNQREYKSNRILCFFSIIFSIVALSMSVYQFLNG